MKKRLIALCMSLAFSLMVFSPVAAVYTQGEVSTVELEQTLPLLEKDTMNEYDCIVEIRNAAKNPSTLSSLDTNLDEEEIEYITSDAIESELLYRASLSTEVLKDHYCYSDEAIAILKSYDGTRLENAPEMRAVTATLSAALGELVKSKTRVGVLYTWSWDVRPLVRWSDYAAVSWDGTYENGGSNDMAFDPYTSFSNVNYYYTDANQKQLKAEFTSDNWYNGAAASFAAEKTINAWYYWAKYGTVYVYVNLVNQDSGPLLYQLTAHGEFAHYTATPTGSVSFPGGASISFTGGLSVLGSRNIYINP